jgi:hypothetical protein
LARISLELTEDARTRAANVDIRRLYNLGSATRNPESARAHQEEVAHIGVKIAFDIPAPRIYPLAPEVITTADEIAVQGDRTSGEVEIVLLMADELYVGVGSDHTDRTLEKVSILWSKQACANVLAPTLWRFADIAAHWDECRLRSWVDGRLYQDCGVNMFQRPEALLDIVRERSGSLPARDFAIFCGTYVSVDKSVGFGRDWRIELSDPVRGRAIAHGYRVANLLDEIRPEFRVPLAARPF